MLNGIQERDLLWLAGLMEGEGSFYSGSPGQAVNLPWAALKMTDRDVVDRVGAMWGVKTMIESHKEKPQHKERYVVRARGRRAVIIMWMLEPYMGARRKAKIKEVLDRSAFYKSGPRKEPVLIETAADLKQRAIDLIHYEV